MAQIAGGFLLPHDPLIAAEPDAPSKQQGDAVRNAFKHVARRLEEIEADTVIVVGDDHYTVFGPQCLPRYLIAIGDAAGPIEPWVGLPQQPFRVNQTLAQHIMHHGFDNGVDWAVAKSITLDHSTALPIHFCIQDKPAVSVVPVLINSGVEPLIPNRRCHELGKQLRAAVEAWDGPERVAILGTGGISHWVGMKDMGRVNPEWDEMIMAAVERGDAEAIIALSDEEIIRESGNGGLEIKNWLVALGFIDRFKGERIEYQAINEWVTGCGFMEIAA
jgi:protocatechuate 4,5-dioxygenase beta chain